MQDQSSTEKLNGSESQQADSGSTTPEFAIQRIYTKDISFETPHSPQIFQQEWQPNVDVQLNASSEKLAQDVYEVKLVITVTTKSADKVAFLVEIQQAGIFTAIHFPEPQLHRMLGSYCPNILFPYAREVVSDLIMRGGFPPLYLAPINFDALYEQQLKQQQQQSQSTEVQS